MKKYGWSSKYNNRKQHFITKEGKSLCKLENGTHTPLDCIKETPHPTRDVCQTCIALEAAITRRGNKKKPHQLSRKRGDAFLASWEWKQVRYMALKASSGHCQCCGASGREGVVLHVDHVLPRRAHPELALTVANLQVLCADCNRGKGNRDSTDWREPDLRVLMGEKMAG